MEQKPEKFRLRLNLFDSIVLILALAAGAFLLWNALKPDAAPEQAETATVRYTVCLQRWAEGASAAVREGARLTDSIRNYEMGRVVSVETVPAWEQIVDHVNKEYVRAEIPGYEDVLITVEASGVITEEAVTVGTGYVVRVGGRAFVQGDGFLGSGYKYAIEREG